MTIKCCKGCTDRKVNCHSACEKYISEKKAIYEQNDKIYKERAKQSQINRFEKESKRRNRVK